MVWRIKVEWEFPHSGRGGERFYLIFGSPEQGKPDLVLYSEDGVTYWLPRRTPDYEALLWKNKEGGTFWHKGAPHRVCPLPPPSDEEYWKARRVFEDQLRKMNPELALKLVARMTGRVKLG